MFLLQKHTHIYSLTCACVPCINVKHLPHTSVSEYDSTTILVGRVWHGKDCNWKGRQSLILGIYFEKCHV